MLVSAAFFFAYPLHREVHLDLARLLEDEGALEPLSRDRRLFEIEKHEVIAARFELDALAGHDSMPLSSGRIFITPPSIVIW